MYFQWLAGITMYYLVLPCTLLCITMYYQCLPCALVQFILSDAWATYACACVNLCFDAFSLFNLLCTLTRQIGSMCNLFLALPCFVLYHATRFRVFNRCPGITLLSDVPRYQRFLEQLFSQLFLYFLLQSLVQCDTGAKALQSMFIINYCRVAGCLQVGSCIVCTYIRGTTRNGRRWLKWEWPSSEGAPLSGEWTVGLQWRKTRNKKVPGGRISTLPKTRAAAI